MAILLPCQKNIYRTFPSFAMKCFHPPHLIIFTIVRQLLLPRVWMVTPYPTPPLPLLIPISVPSLSHPPAWPPFLPTSHAWHTSPIAGLDQSVRRNTAMSTRPGRRRRNDNTFSVTGDEHSSNTLSTGPKLKTISIHWIPNFKPHFFFRPCCFVSVWVEYVYC